MKSIQEAHWICEIVSEYFSFCWYIETKDNIGIQWYHYSKYYKSHKTCLNSLHRFLKKNNIKNYRIKE